MTFISSERNEANLILYPLAGAFPHGCRRPPISVHQTGQKRLAVSGRLFPGLQPLPPQVGYAPDHRLRRRAGAPDWRIARAGRYAQRPTSPPFPFSPVWNRWRTGPRFSLLGRRFQHALKLPQFLAGLLGQRQLPETQGDGPGAHGDGGDGAGYIGPGHHRPGAPGEQSLAAPLCLQQGGCAG